MRSPGPRGYYGGGGGGGRGPPPGRPYKVLCVSELHPKASDDVIRDTLYREYKKYGDISVRVVLEPDERVAYVYFRNFDDARDARHSKSRIILFDKPALVEPVYESRSESSGPSGGGGDYRPRRSMTPPPYGGGGGGGSRYRSRSPIDRGYERRDDYRPRPDYRDEYHDRGGGGGHRGYHDHDRGGGGGGRHYDDHRDGGGGGGGGYRGGRGGYHDGGGRGRGGYRGRGRGGGYHDRGGHGDHGHRGGHHGHYDGGHHRGHYDRRDGGGRGRGGYHGDGGHGGDGGHRKDKFPNYLNHIPPEEDPLATRTLFAGNLELNITDEEMKRIFGRYGRLVDIDVKRPAPGTGNAYAFIRYENLDMAHRAKTELSGQYIGKFQCKIGYGKVNATTKVWVGSLGSWCSENLLWKEFDRFGAIKKIDYVKGDHQAHIFYESLDAAQAAVAEMRGFPLGGPDRRLRIDYADLDVPTGLTSRRDGNLGGPGPGGSGGGGDHHNRSFDGNRSYDRGSYRDGSMDGGRDRRHSGSPGRSRSMSPRSPGAPGDGDDLGSAQNVADIAKKTAKVWDGGLILKNSLFPTKLHLMEGNRRIADALKDESGATNLKITQRLRLDQNKLDDVTKRMGNSSSHAVFLGLSTSTQIQHDSPDVQSRPLRNLISYLKQKEAAGVISMNYKEDEDSAEPQQGVLYCFPPCSYSLDILRRECPNIIDESSKDDHLLVVVVCGSQGAA